MDGKQLKEFLHVPSLLVMYGLFHSAGAYFTTICSSCVSDIIARLNGCQQVTIFL